MALDHFHHQVGEAGAGLTDHLDRVALAGEFDFRGLYFGIGHRGHSGFVTREMRTPRFRGVLVSLQFSPLSGARTAVFQGRQTTLS